jgi:hypothetical protein
MLPDNQKIDTIHLSNAQLFPEVIAMLNEGHTVTLPLRGYSMRPFLEDGRDKALLKLATRPQVGDAVLAEITSSHYVLHRIIRIDDTLVTLRGDGNINTEQCQLSDIKAVAIGFYRKGRHTIDATDSCKWRVYSKVWTMLYPLRRYLLAFYRRIWLKLFKPI